MAPHKKWEAWAGRKKKNTAKLTNRHDKQNVSRKIWKTSCRTRSRERCKYGSGNKMATQWSAQKQEILNINLSTFAWQRFFRVFSLPVFLYAYLLVRWWCFVFVGFSPWRENGFSSISHFWFVSRLSAIICIFPLPQSSHRPQCSSSSSVCLGCHPRIRDTVWWRVVYPETDKRVKISPSLKRIAVPFIGGQKNVKCVLIWYAFV